MSWVIALQYYVMSVFYCVLIGLIAEIA